jgi:hypothetical protein
MALPSNSCAKKRILLDFQSSGKTRLISSQQIHAIPGKHKHDSIIDELAEDGCSDFQRYWTILLLAPQGFYRRGLLKVPRVVSDLEASPLQINIVLLIEDALGAARRAWRGLHQYVEELLGTGTEIFDPELHDSLLSDDELFSGSRKYFWLINSLQTFDNILRQNIEAWISYRDKFLLPLSRALQSVSGITWKKELDESIEICNRLVEDLERIQKLFRDQRERTLALREGVLRLHITSEVILLIFASYFLQAQ